MASRVTGWSVLGIVGVLAGWGVSQSMGETPDVPSHMQQHFTQATQARNAVISGDLDAARAPLQWLAEHRAVEGLPAGWWPYTDQIHQQAAPAVHATSPEVVGRAIAEVAWTCGSCHTQMGAKPRFTAGAGDAPGGTVKAHMAKHLWAADRMWEGLIVPDQASWAAGAAGLADPPVHIHAEIDLSPDAQALARQVHALGAQARETTDLRQQTQIYGRLIATCARCHTLTGANPFHKPKPKRDQKSKP